MSLLKIKIEKYLIKHLSSNIRVPVSWTEMSITGGIGKEGDLVLTQVSMLGARREMESYHNDNLTDQVLCMGDFIIGVLGNRHSSTSEYGDVPARGINCRKGASIDLLSSGGVVGICKEAPKVLGSIPTQLNMIGLICKQGKVLNLKVLCSKWDKKLEPTAPIFLSCGTAAEIGKTTAAKSIIKECFALGLSRIAATKLTGTGRRRDISTFESVNAFPVYDFPDVGLATTYTSSKQFIPAIYTLINKINREGSPSVIIGECGGDIIEGNIPTLLQDQAIIKNLVGIIHSSSDVLGIIGSLKFYESWGILGRVPVFLAYPYQRNFYAISSRLRSLGIHLPIIDPMNSTEVRLMIKSLLL